MHTTFQIKLLNVGEILDQSIAIMKARFGLLLSITLVTVVPLQFFTGMMQLAMFPGLAQGDPSSIQENLGLFFIFWLGTMVLTLLVFPLANGAMIHAVANIYLSRPVTLGSCLRHGLRRWPALLGTTLLMGLVITLGMICLVI